MNSKCERARALARPVFDRLAYRRAREMDNLSIHSAIIEDRGGHASTKHFKNGKLPGKPVVELQSLGLIIEHSVPVR